MNETALAVRTSAPLPAVVTGAGERASFASIRFRVQIRQRARSKLLL